MFFLPKSPLSTLLRGFTDFHSHILPGVDDGVPSLDESLAVLRRYEELGIAAVWLTPHIMEDIPNSPSFLRECFARLQEAYTGPVRLHLAAEHMLDNLFEERLAAGDVLPLMQNHLLVETSYFNPPMDLNGALERIKSRGYYPVLAHPERYGYMDRDDYRRLKERGIKFQSNLSSLAGAYGPAARKKVEWLQKQQLIDFWGTDLHRLHAFEAVIKEKVKKKSLGLSVEG